MTKPNAIRLLIVDDHPIVREALMVLIDRQEDMTVVGEATNGRNAIELFQQLNPIVIIRHKTSTPDRVCKKSDVWQRSGAIRSRV